MRRPVATIVNVVLLIGFGCAEQKKSQRTQSATKESATQESIIEESTTKNSYTDKTKEDAGEIGSASNNVGKLQVTASKDNPELLTFAWQNASDLAEKFIITLIPNGAGLESKAIALKKSETTQILEIPQGGYLVTARVLTKYDLLAGVVLSVPLTVGEAKDQPTQFVIAPVGTLSTVISNNVDQPEPGDEANYKSSCDDYGRVLTTFITSGKKRSPECDTSDRFTCLYEMSSGRSEAKEVCSEEEGRLIILMNACVYRAHYKPSKIECSKVSL
jgi:hypothetical protein